MAETQSLYDLLGVSPDATPEEIKKAYRRLMQKHHPDKPEGNAELSKRVREAYEVLSDPARRERYDQTGDPNRQNMLEFVRVNLAGLFASALRAHLDRPSIRVYDAMWNQLVKDESTNEGELKSLRKRLVKLEKARDLILLKEEEQGKVNIFQAQVDKMLEQVNEGIRLGEEKCQFFKCAKQVMKEEYRDAQIVEPPKNASATFTFRTF